jgi:outer membrane protein TolC
MRTVLLAAGFLFFAAVPPGRAEEAPVRTWTWKQCLDSAWARNPELNKAWTEIERVEGVIINREAILYPNLAAAGGAVPPFFNIGMNQLLFNRAVAPALRSEIPLRAAIALNYQFTLHNIIFGVRMQYLTVLFLQDQIRIRARYLALLESNAKTLPMLFEGGRVRRADVTRLDVNISLARERLTQARLALDLAKLELVNLMGVDPAEAGPLQMLGSLEPALPADMQESHWVPVALTDRLDLQLFRQLRDLNVEEVAIASATAYPQANGYALYKSTDHMPAFLSSLGSSEDGSTKDDDVSKSEIGAQAVWRLFDGGMTRGNKMQAQSVVVTREALIANLEKQIPGEVTVSLESLQLSYDSWASMERGRGLGAESVALANIAFGRGAISQVELIKAEQDAVGREETTLAALYRVELSKLALLRSTGQIIRLVIGNPKEAKNQ